MDFIKKHWEKVLLGVVLVGLVVAVAFLPLKIANERSELEVKRNEVLYPRVKELPSLDLGGSEAAIAKTASPFALDFSTGHRLFNPVLWQKTTDNRPLKVQSGKEVGPAAVEILGTSPLYTVISFDSVITNETGARYAIGIERQAATKLNDRKKRQTYASVGTQTEQFTLTKAVGAAENPEALMLDVVGTEAPVRLDRTKPYSRVDGYMADMKYAPETRTWTKRRVGDKLIIAGEEYNIVAINETEVVLSAPSGKKTSVQMAVAK
jgi:hypothetical protein